MAQDVFQTRTLEFTTPSGHVVTIREQNGADDDILSNPADAATLMNLSKFVASIVVKSDYTQSGRLTVDQVQNIPTLDRYCILINSRIFSLGETLDFDHDWGENRGGKCSYEQDLREFLFDYSKEPTPEELMAKPNAIPYYPMRGKTKDLSITTTSGKELLFDLMTPADESWVANLPLEKQTRNVVLLARNLRLKVQDKFEKVSNFSSFSAKDMGEIRKAVMAMDPIFMGTTEVQSPVTKEIESIAIVGLPGFFYPEEI